MNWPPPNVAPLPPPPPPSPRELSAKPIAAWLAATGGALVLVAAIVVVAGNWQDIAPAFKFAGLVAVTAGLGAAAERGRLLVPATARAVAHLAAALVAPVGIAAAAVTGATWPVCVLIGGALAAVVCDVQARRWKAPLLDGACVIAIGLALVGLAALVPVPVGVLAVITAGALLAARRDAAAVALATAAAVSPILVALAEQRIGDGTLARIGATGDVLAWSAPLVGVLAAGVLAVVASRRNAPAIAVMALAAPLVGVVTGLATRGVDEVVWLCLPAVVLAALELVAAMATTEPWRAVTRPVANGLAAAGAAVAFAIPPIAAFGHSLTGDVPMLPLLLGASALAMTVVRTDRGRGVVGGLAVGGTGSLLIAIAAGLGWPAVVVAAVGAAVGAAGVVVAGPRWLPTIPAMATAAAFLLIADGHPAAEVAVGLVLMGLALELALRVDKQVLDVPAALATFAGAALTASCVPAHWPPVYLAALALAVGHVTVRRPAQAPALLLPVMCGSAVVVAASGSGLDAWLGAGILALAISAAVTWLRTHELWTAHLAAGLAVVAVPFGLFAVGAQPAEMALTMLIVSVVLAGTSFLVVSSGPVATAAMTASVVALVVTPGDAPVLASVAIVILGVQASLEGLIRSRPAVTRGGAAVAAVGAISLWWTTGAGDAVLGWLAPHGVTSGDLAVIAVSALLFAVGAYASRLGERRCEAAAANSAGEASSSAASRTETSSWATAGPGLGVLALWLLDAQLTRDVAWSVPLALGIGIVAVGVGGWRRMAAPLVIGTATVGATIAISAGPRLAALDSWVWMAAGGLGLIVLAVLVERTVGADRTPIDWQRLRSTWR